MKRIITLITMLSLLLALLTIGASAENATAKSEEIDTAYVTIAVKGELVTTQLAVMLEDYDKDEEERLLGARAFREGLAALENREIET